MAEPMALHTEKSCSTIVDCANELMNASEKWSIWKLFVNEKGVLYESTHLLGHNFDLSFSESEFSEIISRQLNKYLSARQFRGNIYSPTHIMAIHEHGSLEIKTVFRLISRWYLVSKENEK